jgi:hypothetical protein
LLESSLKVAYPNGEYPAINDSDPGAFRNFGCLRPSKFGLQFSACAVNISDN